MSLPTTPEAIQADLTTALTQQGLTALLPAHVTPEQFLRTAAMAFVADTELQQADRPSVILALTQCARDGLLPDGREAALVIFSTNAGTRDRPRWVKKAQYLPMVDGVLKRARQSGQVASIVGKVVHMADKFDYWVDENGEHIEHRPAFEDRGEIRLVYAFARMTSGEIVVEVMTRADVDRVRDTVKSASYAASPWMKWYDRMALKTVLHRIARRLPCASELFSLLEAGNGTPATEQARSEPHRHPVRRGLREVLSRRVLPAEQDAPAPAPCPATEERADAPVSDEFDALMIALDDVTDEQSYRPVAERCKTLAQTLTAAHRDALREKVKRTKGRLEKTRREAYTHAENQTPVALAEGNPEPAGNTVTIIPLANSSGTAWRFPDNTVETGYFQAQKRAAAMGCQLQTQQAHRFSASH